MTALLEVDAAAPADLLAYASAQRKAADAAEAQVLLAACQWADLNPPETLADVAYADPAGVPLAGEGAPTVAEFAIAELASALQLSTPAGAALMGEGLEIRHRLPSVWRRMMAGTLSPWRARRIARATMSLSPAAAAYVDRQVAPFAHRIGPAQTDRLVEAAIARFDPDRAEALRRAGADGRHFTIDPIQVSYAGTATIRGELDLADAQDLDTAIAGLAAQLADLGSTESLDVRRSLAAGELARRQLALDLSRPDTAGASTRTRRIVLHVHLSDAALTDARAGTARVENLGGLQLISSEQVRQWCGNPRTSVTVRPVVDLADIVSVDRYEITDDLHERVTLANPTCVFPWCSRQARRCDHDHGVPYPHGPTSTGNLAPLCRHHHRLKTLTRWRYRRHGPTTFIWTSPHGLRFLRDHTGTVSIDEEPVGDARPPDG